MKNYYRFSQTGFSNEDIIFEVEIEDKSQASKLEKIKNIARSSTDAWIMEITKEEAEFRISENKKIAQNASGQPVGARSINSINDVDGLLACDYRD